MVSVRDRETLRDSDLPEPKSGQIAPSNGLTPLRAAKRKLLLIEFNELCPSLLDRWMAAGDLPNFRKFYEASQVFVTESDEQAPNLEPWIQWYTVHTGLSFKQHGVFNLTDGPKAGHPDIWEILSAQGLRVANCSSMNSKGFEYPGSFFLPDPWCTTERPYPEALRTFQRVVANRVQEYTNPGNSVRLSDYLEFFRFLMGHGLRATTCLTVLTQVMSELISRGVTSWRRASLLDRLQFDVFRHYFVHQDFDFATFFSNSTAHYQHSYWRYFEPDRFEATRSYGHSPYSNAIRYGYRQMDRLLGEFLKFESSGCTLMLASALSQQPYLKYEHAGGQNFYRPRNVAALLVRHGYRMREHHAGYDASIRSSVPEPRGKGKGAASTLRCASLGLGGIRPARRRRPGSLFRKHDQGARARKCAGRDLHWQWIPTL